MSFGGKTNALPTVPQKPLGVDESRAATNEQARPLPYLAGRTRVGVTWLADAFDVQTQAVVSSAGKGQTSVRGYNYRASLAALICHGPVDRLEKIYFNGDEVWSGSMTRTGAEDYADITIETHGAARIYWGTPTQLASPIIAGSGYQHPPYKRQCYLTFEHVFFGFNQTNAPNIEVVICRYPKLSWSAASMEVNGDCNPVAIVAEWLQNKIFGLGLPVSQLDTPALDAVAAQLADEGIGLSPYITKQVSARQLITQLCEYFDGYPVLTPEGKFKLGLVRAAEDEGALPLIDEDVLLAEPELAPESWSDVKTKTWVKFLDASRAWKENALPYRAVGTAQIFGDNSPQTLDRTWVTNAQLAQKIVAATGRAESLPSSGGELTVRKTVTLKPGDLFRLSYARLGISNLVMRVESRANGRAGERSATLSVRLDRSYLNDSYHVPEDEVVPAPVATIPQAFASQGLIELPRGLAENGKITIAPLVARPNFYTTGYDIHLRRNYDLGSAQPPVNLAFYDVGNGAIYAEYPLTDIVDETVGCVLETSVGNWPYYTTVAAAGKLAIALPSETAIVISLRETGDPSTRRAFLIRARGRSTMRVQYAPGGIRFYACTKALFTLNYDRTGTDNQFAKHGTVAETYPATTDLIDRCVGLLFTPDSSDQSLESPTLNNALSNELLVFAGNEILSVISVELAATSPLKYRLYCIRGRYDTRAAAHAAGESVFIIERAKLKLLTHSTFLKNTRPTFKLQPTVLSKSVDLATVLPVGVSLTGRIYEPGSPINLAAFDDGYNPTFTTGQNIPLTWNLTELGERDLWSRWGNPAALKANTVLKFFTTDGVLKRTVTKAAGVTSHTYDYTDLVADFVTAQTIVVRAQAYENGLYSRFFEELTIRFV